MADSPPSEFMTIDNLPEHIVLHILSFLPTKTAITTAVLSKSWKHLWTLVPTLDFSHSSQTSMDPFKDFVYKAFDDHKAPFIQRLRLMIINCCQFCSFSHSDLDSWLSSAMQRNLQEIDLGLDGLYDDYDHNLFGKFVFSCVPNSLVDLKLTTSYTASPGIIIGDGARFPALKTLHLNMIEFECREASLSGFLSSRFPVLEELVVENATFDHEIHIYLPTLKRLEIYRTKFEYALQIQSPSLRYIVLVGSLTRDLHVENLQCLVDVYVDHMFCKSLVEDKEHIDWYSGSYVLHEDEYDGESLINFVNAVSQVKILKLSQTTMQELHNAWLHSIFHADSIQVFHNLVEIELELDGFVLGMTMIMIHKFENLQSLTFHKINMDTNYKRAHVNYYKTMPWTPTHGRRHQEVATWEPPTHVPNCMKDRLTRFCFRGFEGSDDEMEITKYILENSLVLKNAKIHFLDGLRWKRRSRIQRKLSTICIGSIGCQLEYDIPWQSEVEVDEWESDGYSILASIFDY